MNRQEQTDKTADGAKKLAARLVEQGVFPTQRTAEARIIKGIVRSEKKSEGK